MVEEDSYCPQVFGLDCMVELSLGMKQVGILPMGVFSLDSMVEEDSYCPQVFGLDCMVEKPEDEAGWYSPLGSRLKTPMVEEDQLLSSGFRSGLHG